MDKKSKLSKIFELFYLCIMTALGVLAICVAIASDWKNGMVSWSLIAIFVCWSMYLLDLSDKASRQIIYTIFLDIVFFIYGMGTLCFADVPIIICLFLTIVAFSEDIRLQYILLLAYPMLIVYHFVTGYIAPGMGSLALSRMFLGIVCIIATAVFARYIVIRDKNEKERVTYLEDRLKQAEKENEQFMANISHELRTPINAVNGACQILLTKDMQPEIKKTVDGIYAAGRRLYGQISDILDYSEIITGEVVVSDTNYEITSVVNDMLQNFVWTDNQKDIEYAIDVQPDIPSQLYGDPIKIRKIISVLFENSMKFTSEGGIYLRISKHDENYGINLIIDMYDTGCGMSQSEINALYDSFENLNMTKIRKTSGLGLGLMIVYGFVRSMGGSLVIDSIEGKNSHIRVTIPQRVINSRPSIAIANADSYKVLCYFNMEKYIRAEVGQYYNRIIGDFNTSLGLDFIQVNSLAEVKQSVADKAITHIVVSQWEYEMDPEFFDTMDESIFVIVVADKNYAFPPGSRIIHVLKPMYMLAIINALKESTPGSLRIVIDPDKVDFKGMRALVVDDDNMNISVATGMLQTFGVEVSTALSGDIAIEKCMIEDFDIIFMDIMMPNMDGVECMNRIRSIRKNATIDVPIVAVTANAVSGARERLMKEGFDDFISKPIEISVLMRVLKKFYRGGAL